MRFLVTVGGALVNYVSLTLILAPCLQALGGQEPLEGAENEAPHGMPLVLTDPGWRVPVR